MSNDIPVNKDAALFLSRKKRAETVNEAIDGAINRLMKGELQDSLAACFTGDFGPDPVVTFKMSVRREAKHSGEFVMSVSTHVSHEVGDSSYKLYHLTGS